MARSFAEDLAAVGVEAESPWVLVNTRATYKAAVPVLLEWLDLAEDEVPRWQRDGFREGLVRALTVKEGRGVAAPVLVREYYRPGGSSSYQWAVGNALEVVADDSIFEELAAVVRDKSFGTARRMAVMAMARMKNPDAVDVLLEVVDGDDVAGQAVVALGRLKATSARHAIERHLDSPRAWIRKEAKKALTKIDRPVAEGQVRHEH